MTAAFSSTIPTSAGTKRSASHLDNKDTKDTTAAGADVEAAPGSYTLLPFYGEHRRAVSSVAFCPTLPAHSHSHHYSLLTNTHKTENYDDDDTNAKSSLIGKSTICASASADGTVKLWDLRQHLANHDAHIVEGQEAVENADVAAAASTTVGNESANAAATLGGGGLIDGEQQDTTSVSSSTGGQPSSSANATSTDNNNNQVPQEHRLMTPIITLQGHSRGINDVAWNPRTGEVIATASDDKTLRLWDITREGGANNAGMTSTGGLGGTNDQGGVNLDGENTNNTNGGLAGNPSTGTGNTNTTSTTSSPDSSLVEFKGHSNFCFSVKFSPNGNLLVSGSFDETVKLWDIRTGECISTLPAHSDPVTGVDFNRDGTCIVSSSHDGLIRIWDVATGECLKTIYAEGNPPVTFVRYSPNGKFVLSGMLDGKLRLWSVLGKFANGGSGLGLDFGLQGSRISSSGGRSNGNGNNSSSSKVNSGLGSLSALIGENESAMYSKSGGQCTKTYSGHVNNKYCIFSAFAVGAANPKRHSIVTGSEDGKIYMYDLQSRAVRQVLEGGHEEGEPVLAVAAHDSKELIASGGMSNDRTVRFWAPKDDF